MSMNAFESRSYVVTHLSSPTIARIGLGLGSLVAVALGVLATAVGSTVPAQTETISTPRELPFAPQAPVAQVAQPVASTFVTVGLNFQGSQLFVDSGFIPPDTMGAVGPDHIVEMINGRFDVYDKTTGNEVFTRSLNAFWTNVVGLTIPAGNTFDPRIVFDLDSGRWFATSIDGGNGNNIYLGRSDTDDPTGDWDGMRFAADTVGPAEFHDYATLALDADGLYICTNDFRGGGNESCYSIPKADLLLAVPSIANMTRFEATPPGLPAVNGSVQPAIDFGPSNGRAALLGASGGALVRSDILGAGGAGATLGTVRAIAGDPGHTTAPAARQPHPVDPTVTIENVTPRFVARVFEEGSSLWAVHAVRGSFSNSAIRWYEIDEVTDTVLQTGLIENSAQDFYQPSIAVNEFGNVVIGYTCSGPSLAPSTCVSVGETVSGVTMFEAPTILAAGAGHYYQDFNRGRNRWGDYSATVRDPADPCTFWTFQEFVAVSAVGDVGPDPRPDGGQWGIQITELTFNSCDSDGDGIPNDEDACPDSNLDPTIVIGSCDSGVENLLFASGCTMADLIAECAENASNHGQFVSCVAHLTNTWKHEGLISGRDKGQIQRCAAKAPADLNSDGFVGVPDLLVLLGAWSSPLEAWQDVEGDGHVGTGELLRLLGAWGSLP